MNESQPRLSSQGVSVDSNHPVCPIQEYDYEGLMELNGVLIPESTKDPFHISGNLDLGSFLGKHVGFVRYKHFGYVVQQGC